jgi:hypothetical protein
VHDAAEAVWAAFLDALPDFSVQVHRVLGTTEGVVVVEAPQGGTQVKDVAGIESKHRATHVPHCFVLDVDDDGRLTHIKAHRDNDTIYAQLGHASHVTRTGARPLARWSWPRSRCTSVRDRSDGRAPRRS